MTWPLMTPAELHAFGIDAVLFGIEKEGVTVESVNDEIGSDPQIIGRRWGSPAFIMVRAAMAPDKGELTRMEFERGLAWARKHGATAFFASVCFACAEYPDKTPVGNDDDLRLPIRNASFKVAYEGLLVMTTSDRVRVLDEPDGTPS